ncbi:hypothetical protein LS482_17335 [Sinomicrobium kalidii]|uniref:BfmA/BtgA family mobilization protein n=1 Tax=Sinomicrobium kalidii TaxID=2900738 RepID=UPI001E4DC4EE|nr:BfmA/BtgA family mobilization protein [Sinomicrobium kalidii]UGU15433.1 hypothetical protein LS482_17335 [Sinomicrobium kalidii]
MDKGYEKERFESLSIKTSVVKKFRKFCKAISRSQSMTLLLMIEFFEHNGISPKESIGPNVHTLESLIKRRIHGVISIIKDMEKHQTKPTVAMLQNLFEQAESTPGKKPVSTKKSWKEKSLKPGHGSSHGIPMRLELEEAREQVSLYRNKHAKATQELSDTRKEVARFLNKIKPIRSNFGKPYLRIDLPPESLEYLKRKLNLNE